MIERIHIRKVPYDFLLRPTLRSPEPQVTTGPKVLLCVRPWFIRVYMRSRNDLNLSREIGVVTLGGLPASVGNTQTKLSLALPHRPL